MDSTHRLTTKARKITRNGELAWGGENDWSDELDQSEDVIVQNGQVKPASEPVDGLIAQWELNGNATDSVGDHHGTVHGGVEFVTDSERGEVTTFNGEDGYIHATENSLDGATEATVSGWMKSTQTSDWHAPFAYNGDNDANYGYIVRYNLLDDVVEFIVNGTTHKTEWADYDNYDGAWHLLTAVWDHGTMLLYRDGELVASKTTTEDTVALDGDFNIGRYRWDHADDNWWYLGAADDVRIYNQALSGNAVGRLWTATK